MLGEPFAPAGSQNGFILAYGLMDLDISLGAKLCYALFVQVSAGDRCTIKNSTIGGILRLKERQVRRYIAELEASLLLTRENEGGMGQPNTYVFHRHPCFENSETRAKVLQLHGRANSEFARSEMAAPVRSDRATVKCDRATPSYSSSSKKDLLDDEGRIVACPGNGGGREPDEEGKRPVEIFRLRMERRHSPHFPWQQTLKVIRRQLESGNVPLQDFLELDALVTMAPGRLSNPGGHYCALAQELVREAKNSHHPDIGELYRKFEEENKFQYRCTNGCDQGIMPDGDFCACKAGRLAQEIQERREAGQLAN